MSRQDKEQPLENFYDLQHQDSFAFLNTTHRACNNQLRFFRLIVPMLMDRLYILMDLPECYWTCKIEHPVDYCTLPIFFRKADESLLIQSKSIFIKYVHRSNRNSID